MLETLVPNLKNGIPLTDEEVCRAVDALIEEGIGADEKAGFLIALAEKGETPEEIAAFARELRGRAVQPPIDEETRRGEILDVCGTGGDRLHTFNISTTVSIIAAAAGICVAKHGNRAITSQSGSADVLEELGIPVGLGPDEAARSLREHQFAFFFAPNFHPAFKHIAPCRKLCAERGHRTIFNFLGPLLNPARPSAQLVGVPRPELCAPVAKVLKELGVRRVMVVSGETEQGHLDELSTFSGTHVAEFYQERGFHESVLDPAPFGFQKASLADLEGSDRKGNAATTRRILSGEERGPKREAVLLNAAAALFVAGKAKSLGAGLDEAAAVIDTGKALSKLKELAGSHPLAETKRQPL